MPESFETYVGRRDMRLASALLLMHLWAASAAAQAPDKPGADAPRRGPPPEAIESCKSLASGAACSVNLGSKTIKGTCWAPEGKPLACKPANGPGPNGGMPAPGNQ